MTILNSEMIMIDNIWYDFFSCLGLAVILCGFLFLIMVMCNYDLIATIITGSVYLILIILINILVSIIPQEIPTNEYRYEVILDEKYPARELMADYEILETRGEIYVITERK